MALGGFFTDLYLFDLEQKLNNKSNIKIIRPTPQNPLTPTHPPLLKRTYKNMLQYTDNIVQEYKNMSSYIIAGSADSLDTAYCEQLARRIKSKYKNIDFRVVIKHPSEWQQYLNQICRIYGFLKKSNPIIYTYHGKIIGNKDAFVTNTVKYFGLTQDLLLVKDLSTNVNVKLANQDLAKKKAFKNNIKTLSQKIQTTYDRLLKAGLLKHQFKTKEQFLVNGVQYYFRQVPGICPPITFQQHMNIAIQSQNIAASNLNLLQLSLQDQITPQKTQKDKQPFLTNQAGGAQIINTESMQRMSEASRTNKLQSSIMSKDEDSKINKQSNKEKGKIDQEFDDVADFNNVNMDHYAITELGDLFWLAFQAKTHLSGEMVLYRNQGGVAAQGHQGHQGPNFMRIYSDRPVIGHHTIIKEIHYIGETEFQEPLEHLAKENEEEAGEFKEEGEQKARQHPNPTQKSKTQPNIPLPATQKKPYPQNQSLSQPCSDLHLPSNLNYHTLYILKPLSNLQLHYLTSLLGQTNTVGCLQFLPQNSNPKIRVYNRGMLLESCHSLFPVQNFINKQIQDGELDAILLPRDCQDRGESGTRVLRIRGIGFHHVYSQYAGVVGVEDMARLLKLMIDEVLFLEETLKKEIGYNLIITKKFIMVVALTEPYKIFGSNPMYFDGLSYLGFVQVAKVQQGYKLKEENIDDGHSIRQALARCSGFKFDE